MSDSPIRLDSDSESDVPFAAEMRVSSDSQSPPFAHGHIRHKFVSLSDESNSKRVSGNSFDEKTSSLDSFEDLLLDDGGKEDHINVHIPHLILYEEEIQATKLMRERANDFV